MRARAGLVTPAPDGPHVEQVGQGVARQVVRLLRDAGVEDPAGILGRLPEVAEEPGFLAYVVFEGRTATGAAVVELDRWDQDGATYLGEALTPQSPPGTAAALVVRALHDVASAGHDWLSVSRSTADLGPLGFG